MKLNPPAVLDAIECREELEKLAETLQSSALDDADQDYDDGNDEQYVYEPAHAVGRYQAKGPEYQQNNGNCFQHSYLLGRAVVGGVAEADIEVVAVASLYANVQL